MYFDGFSINTEAGGAMLIMDNMQHTTLEVSIICILSLPNLILSNQYHRNLLPGHPLYIVVKTYDIHNHIVTGNTAKTIL